MKNIAAAFVKAKKAFRPALKEKANPAFKGSKYADLSSCIEAVDDALLDNGIAMYQENHEDETGVTVETVFLHESGESFRSGKLHVPASKQDPQGYGSALTYARRYSLMAACGISPEDDDGNAASKPKASNKLTDSAVADFVTTIKEATDIDSLMKSFGVAYKAAQHVGDTTSQDKFKAVYESRKSYFETAIASQA